MKLSVKTFALLASLASCAMAAEDHGDNLRKLAEPPFMQRELSHCDAPDDLQSQIVELSYYDPFTPITVNFVNGVPDKIFKLSGCGLDGTDFYIATCDLPPDSGLDAAFSVWTRDGLDYIDQGCIDADDNLIGCSDLHEYAAGTLFHYEEEVYIRPGVYYSPNTSYAFYYAAVDYGVPWPCFPSVTATYVHGSTEVDLDLGSYDNIVADFFYTGHFPKDDADFDVVIYDDQTCTKGNEVASTIYPFSPPYPAPFDISIAEVGSYPEEYHRVTLQANISNWAYNSDLWDEVSVPGKGILNLCLQFRVDDANGTSADGDDLLLEFVDVAYEIEVDLEAACECDAPDAVRRDDSRCGGSDCCMCPCNPYEPDCGKVTIIRDEVTNEDIDVDPDIPLTCEPCEGDTTVTQGEMFPVCVYLDDLTYKDQYCIGEIVSLDLKVDNGYGSYTVFTVYPDATELNVGEPQCDSYGCVFQMNPPAQLIEDLEAGNSGDSLVGTFSGLAYVTVDCSEYRERNLQDAVAVPFQGKSFDFQYEKKEKEEEDQCKRQFKFMERLCELFRRIFRNRS